MLFDKDNKLITYPLAIENTTYVVPFGTTKIGFYSLYYAVHLKQVVIPQTVNEIISNSLSYMSNLEKIIISAFPTIFS